MHPDLEFAARRRGGVFTVADARRAGYRPDEIRAAVVSGAWHRLRRGVYVPADVWAVVAADGRARHLLDTLAAVTVLGAGPVVSHSSAARFHRLVLPRQVDDVVRLTHADQWRTGRGYRIAAAELPPEDVVVASAFAVTSAARTLIDCAREWPLTDAVVALDAALFEQRVLRADLAAAILRQSHWLGIGNAARAVGLADGRAESPLETRGRLAIVRAGLPCPELQAELHGPHGFVARVDGWYEDACVALEFDGRVKYDDPRGGRTPAEVAWEEKRREDKLRDLDVRTVRIVQADLPRLDGPVERLRGLLSQPFTGPRRFRVVRRPEPGAGAGGAVA
ncbi:type IV toxin-antitoxin system AbiEi family antitoxin domain-containing protein [Blastococcus goldschmidtiae]|uniref:Type IV toxin-antitoxin system AbiEi family antitoxin domain-containing protein n=1 Tax=Blastococcus goldschmidtiae TaxID=3075546 RepID=A0ABU2KDV0_9ACTN|nr:type IV toxin-antitoxin system AbiEi family antitoxin domain-containing protein [Blastococcus sp. DSM 46792]MDT0278337.1 type IV toxin-antitoxin system AbiEi family antitoxin domain-containing protein [Blastococcus sp. DSM 46792]